VPQISLRRASFLNEVVKNTNAADHLRFIKTITVSKKLGIGCLETDVSYSDCHAQQ